MTGKWPPRHPRGLLCGRFVRKVLKATDNSAHSLGSSPYLPGSGVVEESAVPYIPESIRLK